MKDEEEEEEEDRLQLHPTKHFSKHTTHRFMPDCDEGRRHNKYTLWFDSKVLLFLIFTIKGEREAVDDGSTIASKSDLLLSFNAHFLHFIHILVSNILLLKHNRARDEDVSFVNQVQSEQHEGGMLVYSLK